MSLKHTKKKKRSSPGSDIPLMLPSDYENPLRGSDFFKFVNGKWIDSVRVPPYISSYGVSEELEQSIQKTVSSIVKTCIEKSKQDSPKTYEQQIEVAIGKVSYSALNPKVQSKSVTTLQTLLMDLRCIRDTTDVARTLGELCRHKVPGVFWLFGQYENQNKARYTYTIGIGRVGLPDLSYYRKTAPGKGKTLFQYANLLRKVGSHFGLPSLSSVVPLEEILAGSIQKSLSDTPYICKGSDLATEFPKIPFEALFSTYGLQSWKTETFFVDSRNWMETLQKMILYLPLDSWKLLFATEILIHFLPYLPPPFDDEYFAFFHKKLRGQTEKLPQKVLTLVTITDWMTPFISKLYVEYEGNPLVKRQVGELVKELRRSAKDRLETNDWLQPATRKKAIEKVDRMIVSVGYPNTFAHLPVPTVSNDNLVLNLLALGDWQTTYELSRLGDHRKDQKDWDQAIFAVNAYYYTQSNEMVIPLGSLYWPFFSPTAPLGWNYGGLGCILAHELTHAFDKEGKEYDPDGFLKKWWTPSDNRAYNKKVKHLNQLFSAQKILEHPVSGTLTSSENIADLGGMAIALDALHKHLKTRKVSKEEEKKALQQFFISYAVSWRVKEKPEKTVQGLFLDQHAPPKLRVNLIVSQFDEWYTAFEIPETAKLYIPPEKRIRIF